MSDIQNIIIGTALGGAISILSTYFGYRWTRNVNRIADFNKAASNLRIDLINHSRIIKRTNFIEIHADALDIAFTNVETAFIEFRNLLPNSQRERINTIWDEYNNKNKTHKDIVKFHTYDLLNSVDKKNLKENLLVNIETLIEFAKPK